MQATLWSAGEGAGAPWRVFAMFLLGGSGAPPPCKPPASSGHLSALRHCSIPTQGTLFRRCMPGRARSSGTLGVGAPYPPPWARACTPPIRPTVDGCFLCMPVVGLTAGAAPRGCALGRRGAPSVVHHHVPPPHGGRPALHGPSLATSARPNALRTHLPPRIGAHVRPPDIVKNSFECRRALPPTPLPAPWAARHLDIEP
jgi:hypothetical protein